MLKKYENEFFTKIKPAMKTKGRHVAKAYFMMLRPMNDLSDARMLQYNALLSDV